MEKELKYHIHPVLTLMPSFTKTWNCGNEIICSFMFMQYLFQSPHFLPVLLHLKWVSVGCIYICVSCFCICSATLCLLNWAFSLFTFKIIINKYILFAIFKNCFGDVCVGLFFSLFLFCSHGLILYLVLGLDLFFVCVSLTDCLWLSGDYYHIYTYIIVLSCWSLTFKCTLIVLPLYSSPLLVTVFDAIFYI